MTAAPDTRELRSERSKSLWLGFVAVAFVGCGELSSPEPVGGGESIVLDFADYSSFIAPILSQRGCANASCHGGQGSGELLLTGGLNEAADFEAVKALTIPGDPAASPLVRKPLAVSSGGEVHGGGDIFATASDTDYQTLLKWIGGEVLP